MLELNSSKLYGVLTVEAFCVVSWSFAPSASTHIQLVSSHIVEKRAAMYGMRTQVIINKL